MAWKDERECHGTNYRLYDGEIKEAARLTCHMTVGAERTWVAELKRTGGSITVLGIVWRMLPRNGGRALFLLCPGCNTPRRFVYGWEWDRFSGRSNVVRRTTWCCSLVTGCATLPKAVICGQLMDGLGNSASCFAPLVGTCHVRRPGCPACSLHPKRRRRPASVRSDGTYVMLSAYPPPSPSSGTLRRHPAFLLRQQSRTLHNGLLTSR